MFDRLSGWSRRQLLQTAGLAGFAALNLRSQSDEGGANNLSGVWLEPFVDPLPVPKVLRPRSVSGGRVHYALTMSEFRQKVHRDLPASILWGFEGATPGPTIAAQRDRPIEVHWINKLPDRHRLTIDHTLGGAAKDEPEVRTSIHLHGGHVAANSDGYPDDWVAPGDRQLTYYPNGQPAATLWYHDHAMGITRLNAMMGLAGFYLLYDPAEKALGLPAGAYDIPLLLQDRLFDARGQLIYPTGPDLAAPWIPEFFGTHALVNGKIWPYLQVEPRPYRFRLLNGSNSRIFRLTTLPQQAFIQIASDGGLLPEVVQREDILLAPGERVDVVLDFTAYKGHRLNLINDAPAPYPSGNIPGPRLILQFRVGHRTAATQQTVVASGLASAVKPHEKEATKTRRHTLREVMAIGSKRHSVLLNGQRFDDPVTEDPKNNSIEIWEFVNLTMDSHPIHLHAVHFQLLDRTPFDAREYLNAEKLVLTGKPLPPAPGETGWKDTIICPPGQLTRIIIPFRGEPGRFVWHCHMLEHEDNEMMRPYILRP